MNFLLLNLIIALLFSSVTVFLIGLFVLLKSKGSNTKKIFALYSFAVSWWAFFHALSNMSQNPAESLFWIRISFIGVWLIPVFTIHFFISFLNLKGRQWIIWIGYAQAIFFSIMNFTPHMISGAESRFFLGNWILPNEMFHFAVAFFLIYAIYGFYELFRAYLKSSGAKRNQLNYLLWPTLFAYIGGSANFLLVYRIYVPVLSPFSTYFVGFYVFAIAYAILKYQLMDIRIVIKKAFFYSAGIAIISGFITGISFLSSWFVENIPGFQFWTIPLIVGIVAFIIGNLFWKKSKEVEKMKYEFITVATHKLRTPLTQIKWAATGLKKETVDEQEKQNLTSSILTANERLIELTNELLDVSRSEAQQYQYKFEPASPEQIARKSISAFQRQINEKNIKLSFAAEDNLPMLNVDKERIFSVIQILFENAIAYTKDKIILNIKKEKSGAIFSIRDNGIGIAKKDQSYIFSRFFRTHRAYLSETEGAGLGLFIAKGIIERHNGKIGVKSEGEGKGSEFWFTLPAAEIK